MPRPNWYKPVKDLTTAELLSEKAALESENPEDEYLQEKIQRRYLAGCGRIKEKQQIIEQ